MRGGPRHAGLVAVLPENSITSSSRRSVICFLVGSCLAASANHASSRIGAASGSSATACAISSSLSDLTRSQSVQRSSGSVRDRLTIYASFAMVCSPCRDDSAGWSPPCVDDRQNFTIDLTESHEPVFAIVEAHIGNLDHRPEPDPLRVWETD